MTSPSKRISSGTDSNGCRSTSVALEQAQPGQLDRQELEAAAQAALARLARLARLALEARVRLDRLDRQASEARVLLARLEAAVQQVQLDQLVRQARQRQAAA